MDVATQSNTSPATQDGMAPAAENSLGWTDKRSFPRRLRSVLALEDFEAAARDYLPRPIFAYISGGSESGATLRNNRAVFDEIAFVPQPIADTTRRTLATTLFGQTYAMPFGFCPMGGTSLAGYQGDLVLARVAAAANIPMIMSEAALTPLEQVRAAGPTTWYQTYPPGNAEVIAKIIERVERAGFDTMVVTVDVPVPANRENNVRNGFNLPLRPTPALAWECLLHPRWFCGSFLRTLLVHGMPYYENMGPRVALISKSGVRGYGRRDQLTWEHLELMRRLWKGRLILKGILDPGSARRARESGMDGVIVSNHGGRQLDGSIASLRALPAIVEQAKDMVVMLDSGIRRGTDVLKALALGVKFVFVGRPMICAAAIGGETAVHHAVNLLRDEVDRNIALLGISSPAEMSPRLLSPAHGTEFLTEALRR